MLETPENAVGRAQSRPQARTARQANRHGAETQLTRHDGGLLGCGIPGGGEPRAPRPRGGRSPRVIGNRGKYQPRAQTQAPAACATSGIFSRTHDLRRPLYRRRPGQAILPNPRSPAGRSADHSLSSSVLPESVGGTRPEREPGGCERALGLTPSNRGSRARVFHARCGRGKPGLPQHACVNALERRVPGVNPGAGTFPLDAILWGALWSAPWWLGVLWLVGVV